MKKRILPTEPERSASAADMWLDVEALAELEITSEDPEHPIDDAVAVGTSQSGWRASNSGEQLIRIRFTEPQRLQRIHLVFQEEKDRRTQEFVLRWSTSDAPADYREIVRQQYNFSPPDTTQETEDYKVDLTGVRVLELSIVPAIGRGDAYASLKELRLA